MNGSTLPTVYAISEGDFENEEVEVQDITYDELFNEESMDDFHIDDLMDEQLLAMHEESEQIDREIESLLAEENITLEGIEFTEEGISINVSQEDWIGNETTVELEIETGSEEIEIYIESDNFFQEDETLFFEFDETVSTIESSSDDITGTLFDENGKELYDVNLEDGTTSASVAIPAYIGWKLAAAAIVTLLATRGMIVVSKASYLIASKVITKIRNNKNRKCHYRATLDGGKLYIGDGVSRSTAASWMRSGKSVWSISANQAKLAAKQINGNVLSQSEVDTNKDTGKPLKGYYRHYYSKNRIPKGHHSFYGVAY